MSNILTFKQNTLGKGSGLTPMQMHASEIMGREKFLRMQEITRKMG